MLKDLYVIIAFLLILWIVSSRKGKKKISKVVVLLIFCYIFFFCLPEIFRFLFPKFTPKLITYLRLEETRKTLDKIKKLQGSYPKKIAVTDGWGQDVIYHSSNDKYIIISAGEDGKFNTNDDIRVGSLTFHGELYEKPQKVLPNINIVEKKKVQPLEFTLNCPSQLYIAKTKYYQKNPFATVVLKTKLENLHNVKISFNFDNNYFQTFVSTIPVLTLDTPQLVYFYLFPEEKLFSVEKETTSLLTVSISYSTERVSYSTATTQEIVLYPKNKIDWTEPEMLACFVSTDSSVSREILTRFSDTLLTPVTKAAIFYYTLKAAGFRYKSEIKEEIGLLNDILISKEGNCSELAVLYLSLLSMSNVSSAAIISEEHVWCAFGVSQGKGYDITQGLIDAGTKWLGEKVIHWIFPLRPDPKDVIDKCRIDKDGKKYLPVNISAVGEKEKLFTQAIIEGWNFYTTQNIIFVDISAARKKGYLPLCGMKDVKFSIPDRKKIEKASKGELKKFFSLNL